MLCLGIMKELFCAATENNSETVFDVEYSGAEGGSYGCFVCLDEMQVPVFKGYVST